MTKLSLKVQERLGINRFLNEAYQAGGLDLKGLSTAQKLIDKITILPKEFKTINWKETGDGRATWSPSRDKGKDFEFTSDEKKMLTEIIENKNKEKKFGAADMFVIDLAKKLKIDIDD